MYLILNGKEIKEEKDTLYIQTYTGTEIYKEEILMTVTVLISETGSAVTACIYDYFCPVPILYYFFL